MTTDLIIRRSNKDLLNSVMNRVLEDDDSVSWRTQRTRDIGAYTCLGSLVEGDWEMRTDERREEVQEFLKRVLANAERQGVLFQVSDSH